MTVNISSRAFSLTIAGVTRTSELKSILLSQPSTLERRDAPVTGSITLTFNPLRYNEFIAIGDPAIAINWAVGSAVVFQSANDAGTLVNNLLSGGSLYILKEPSPPVIPEQGDASMVIEVGDILAYQSQRTADSDVSGVTIGTNTDRDDIVIRVLQDAGISSYSIPSLSYPFNTPVQKTGGSPIKLAGDLVGAVKHVLYCNAAGTVIASPIDTAASPVATLTIGSDEAKFDPVDGSSIPTVTELRIAGVVQVPDVGSYPLLSIKTKTVSFNSLQISLFLKVTIERVTQEITSENYQATVTDTKPYNRQYSSPSSRINLGTVLGVIEGDYYPYIFEDVTTTFDSLNRLSKRVKRKYRKTYTFVYPSSSPPYATDATPWRESNREVEYWTYNGDAISEYIKEVYVINFVNDDPDLILLPQTRATEKYEQNGVFWIKTTTNETTWTYLDSAYKGKETRVVTVNSTSYSLIGFPSLIPVLNYQEGESSSESNNDGSTRPPSTTYSETIRTKNQEIGATINVIPIAGVPSKEKHSPITVDWLTSDAHAFEYGQLEVLLMGGRKQCRFFVGQLTDTLATLRPRSRIDIVFNGLLYRCLVDAIAFSQDLTSRTIGFMCDVVSTSPAATPSTVYKPIVTNSAICAAIATPATAAIVLNIAFDTIFAQSSPATAAIVIGVEITATITAQAQTATAIISGTFTP